MKKLALALLVSSPLCAAPILQNSHDYSHTINFFNPIGQSFTAEDAAIESIGFSVITANAHHPFGSLTVKLFDGNGFGGALLGTSVVNPAATNMGAWTDADFSTVNFTVGQQYTFQVLSTNSSYYWATQEYVSGPLDTYVGGSLYLNGIAQAGDDMRFRVTPAPVGAVPEPSSFLFLGIGSLAVIGLGLRRRTAAIRA